MKRAHEVELELVVDEIVKEANAKDEKGTYLYSFMEEPFVIVMFQAPEALLEILKERPILLLNLLQTNKALRDLWERFPSVWILLTDVLVEKEMGSYAGEIYPFFVMDEHKQRLLDGKDASVINADFVGRRTGDGYSFRAACQDLIGLRRAALNNANSFEDYLAAIDRGKLTFYVVYYDEVTRLYVRLFAKLNQLWYLTNGRPFAESSIFSRYLDFGTPVCTTPLAESFLVATLGQKELVSPGDYDLQPLEDAGLFVRVEIGGRRRIPPNEPLFRTYDEVVELRRREQYLREEAGLSPEEPIPVKLDKNTAKPYRDLLYDKEQGLYRTQEQQKAFFIVLLNRFAQDKTREQMIKEYGEHLPLAYLVCRSKTHLVDPLMATAFCSLACRLVHK